MSENIAPAACTDREWKAAREAGLLFAPLGTTEQEKAIHAFALLLRPPPLTDAELNEVVHAFDRRADLCSDDPKEAMALMRDVCRAAIAKAEGGTA